MLKNLIFALERSFDRSGVFYVCQLGPGENAEEIAHILPGELQNKGIAVTLCPLEVESTRPFERFDETFKKAKANGQPIVLVVWTLEHLPEPQLLSTLHWFNASRERLGQWTGQISIPIVLLVTRTLLCQHVVHYMGDLLDCSLLFDLAPS
jgi:hypothetical protein